MGRYKQISDVARGMSLVVETKEDSQNERFYTLLTSFIFLARRSDFYFTHPPCLLYQKMLIIFREA